MYLRDESVSTVSDIVDRLREEYSQLGQGDNVSLYLDSFLLPAWEDINIVQSGDLIKVMYARFSLVDTNNTRFSLVDTNSLLIGQGGEDW